MNGIQNGFEMIGESGLMDAIRTTHPALGAPDQVAGSIKFLRDLFAPGTPPIPDEGDRFYQKWNQGKIDEITSSEAKSLVGWMRNLDEEDRKTPEIRALAEAIKAWRERNKQREQ